LYAVQRIREASGPGWAATVPVEGGQ
jgi:hypothetical protein